nr:MAG TPA: hypothetical protein [Caudoviricetes sp.]
MNEAKDGSIVEMFPPFDYSCLRCRFLLRSPLGKLPVSFFALKNVVSPGADHRPGYTIFCLLCRLLYLSPKDNTDKR